MLIPFNFEAKFAKSHFKNRLKIISVSLFLIVTLTTCEQKQTEPLYKKIANEKQIAPRKAAIKGTVQWNKQPVTDVKVLLCQHVFNNPVTGFNCGKKIAESVPDATGVYWFTDLEPDSYAPVVMMSGTRPQYFYMRDPNLADYTQNVTLHADETVEVKLFEVYRSDVKVLSPKNNEQITDRRPALNWESYPGADSYFVYVHGSGSNSIKTDSQTPGTKPTEDLPNGKYTWGVWVYGKDQSTKIATTPDDFSFEVVDQLPVNTNPNPKKNK